MVLVVDEEEVFVVQEDPEGVSALSDDDLPPLEFLPGEGAGEGAVPLVHSTCEGSSCGVTSVEAAMASPASGGVATHRVGGTGGDGRRQWRQFDPGG